jgi:hypothetical protein
VEWWPAGKARSKIEVICVGDSWVSPRHRSGGRVFE